MQTEKGTFAYVQVKFTNSADNLRVQTKGMTMDTLATKINDGTDIWNTDVTSRCDVLDDIIGIQMLLKPMTLEMLFMIKHLIQ